MKGKFLFILLLIPWLAFSQKQKVKNNSVYDMKPIHFGFTVGLNVLDFALYPSKSAFQSGIIPNSTVLHPGFNINVVSSLRLNKYMNLRFLPGISFGQRTIHYYDKITGETFSQNQKIESSFLEFPLLVKYKSERVNNFRPYLIAGFNYRLDLAAKKNYDLEKQNYVRLKRSDIYTEVGFGIDFFLFYFKLSTELKYSIGLRNMLVDDPVPGYEYYVTTIDKLKSRMWILSFHFE